MIKIRLKLLTFILIVFSFFAGFYMIGAAKSYAACCPSGSHVCGLYCPHGVCGTCSCIGYFSCCTTECISYGTTYSCNCRYNATFHCDTCWKTVTYCWQDCNTCSRCYSCANYNCCSDCVPVACSCTPTCPTGYTKTYQGPYCPGSSQSCTCSRGCGQTSTYTATCYPIETNIAPSAPASADICYTDNATFNPADSGDCYDLVDGLEVLPQASDKHVFLWSKTVSIPSGSNSRGIRYKFTFDGVASAWLTNPWYEVNLVSGADHSIAIQAGTLDRCDDDIKPSSVLSYNLVHVNTPPIIEPSDPLILSEGIYFVGTEEDLVIEDLELTPEDNNPRTYSASITDADGVNDIETFGVLLSSTPSLDDVPEWEAFVMFSMDYEGDPPSFYIMSGDEVRGSIVADQVGSIYTLGEDIVFNDGEYDITLKGGDSFVTVGVSQIDVSFTIMFRGDKNRDTSATDTWEGVYANMWYAEDDLGANDITDGYVNKDGRYFQQFGKTSIDFTPPVAVSEFSLTECGELASNESCWVLDITELEEYDSGIYYIDGVKYSLWPVIDVLGEMDVLGDMDDGMGGGMGDRIEGEGVTEIGDVDLSDTTPTNYSNTYKITKVSEEQLAGVSVDNIIDGVGNILRVKGISDGNSDGGDSGILWEEGFPWIRTLGGDVYGSEGFNNKILAEYPEGFGMYMSQYWIGGGGEAQTLDFSPGIGSLKRWISAQYDNTNAYSWYTSLRKMAISSDCAEDEEDDCIFETGTGVAERLDDERGVYMINLSGAEDQKEELAIGSECTVADKVIFITGGTLEINPNFTSDGSTCLFISDGDITILPGEVSGGTVDRTVDPVEVILDVYDLVEASFIVDGVFTVELDGEERLEINGSVFAGDTDFMRALSVPANRRLPAELINYVPLQFLFEDILGRRLYHQFECGIYDNLPSCTNWE